MEPVGTKRLETERLLLRRISQADAESLYRDILSNKQHLYFLDWSYAEDLCTVEAFIENIISSYFNEYYFFWVMEEKTTGAFAGCIFVCHCDIKKRLAEVEYTASGKAQGHGYMTEALNKVIDFLIDEVGFYRVEGVCNVENTASARVMEKAGMVMEGILRGRALNLNKAGNPGDLRMYSCIPSDRKRM